MNKGKRKYKTITGRYFYERPDQGIRNLISVINGMFIIAGLSFISASFNSNEISNEIEVQAEEIVMFGDKQEVLEVELIESEPIEEILTEGTTIEDYIRKVFGEDAEDALKIATCESGLKQETVGDTNIMLYDSKWDEMVGDSIGIFQVRTGGTGWNRARANGFSADQFRTKLKEYSYNIDYAKTIFDQRGWTAWYLCSQRAL